MGYNNKRPFMLENNIAKFNTICSGEDTTCIISDEFSNGSGAFTDMEDFSVHLPILKDEKKNIDAKAIWGVDLHELAHIMFSPSAKQHGNLVRNYGNIYVYAEENRIENLYHIMAPGNKGLMSHGVTKATGFNTIGDEISTMSNEAKVWNYYLNCLRPWNSNGWLNTLRDDVCKILDNDSVDRIDELVLEYSMLPKSNIMSRAPKILDEIKSLIPYNPQKSDDQVCQGSDHGSGGFDFDDSSIVEEFQNIMGGSGSGQGGQDGDSDGQGSGQDDDSDGQGSGSGSGSGQGDDSDGQGSGQGDDSDGDDSDGQGSGEGGAIASQIGDKDAEGTSPIRDDSELARESSQATKEYNSMNTRGGGAGWSSSPLRTIPKSISSDDKSAMKVFKRKLEEIEEELDPGYINNLPSGSIYMNEAMKPNRDINKMFRQWNAGANEELGIEVVILIDKSGSMSSDNLSECASKTWSFTKALEALGESNVTIMTFNASHDYLYNDLSQIGATQVNVPIPGGGTNPASALDIAEGIFDRSILDRKMLLVFTDGEWNCPNENKNIIKRIGKSGVSTGMMYFINEYSGEGSHYVADAFDYNIRTSEMSDLAKMGKTIVDNLVSI